MPEYISGRERKLNVGIVSYSEEKAALSVVGNSNFTGIITATSFSKSGGTSSQFLKADGSVDSSTYLTSYTETQTLNDVLGLGNTSTIGLSVGVVTTTALKGFDYLQAPHGSTVNYAVTVAAKTAAHRYNGSGSGNGYLIDGVESPFLTLTPGRTYRFTLSSSDMSSHPFRFYLEADRTTAYTTNVTSTATYTEIVVTDTTPTVLHYQCSAHGYMGNAVQVNSNKVNTPYQIDGLKGANITGVVTATSFVGDITGDVTGNSDTATTATNAQGLTGSPDITITNVTGVAATFSGNVTIGGTLSYQDVENIDSIGIITAQQGIQVLANGLDITGFSTFKTGVSVTGVVTATTFKGSLSTNNLEGTITNSQLDGSIANDKLANSSIAIGGITFNLGDTDATPAFDLSDATSYPYTSLTGVTTEVSADTTPQLGGNLDLNSKDITGTGNVNVTGIITATALAGFDYLQAPHGSTVNYSVTVASKTSAHRYNGTGSGNGYVINGVESPFLTLTPGRTYRFTLSSSDMSSHPFRFYLEADKTTAYTTNVTSTATYTEIVVTDETPIVLHYQCSAHEYMGNAVQTNSNKLNTPYQIDGLKGANITGVVTATSFVGDVTGDVTGNADTSTTATNVTVSANNSTDETVYPIFVDGATGSQGAESDTGLTYNPNSGTLTATTFSGSGSNLTGLTGASAATYGSAGATPVIVVNSDGRITAISTVATSGGGGGGGISNVVEDTTPQLGGNLDLNGKTINGTGNIKITGIATATSFVGSGSGLTGLTGASAATYGSAGATPVIVVDSDGRITGISTVATSGGGGGGISNVVEDTTPQLGGNLDLNGKTINGTGNMNVTGIVTSTTLSLSADSGVSARELSNIGSANIVQTKITGSNSVASDYFGFNVAIGGTIIAAGAYGVDTVGSLGGAVYLLDLDGNQLGIITASDGAAEDRFGHSVAIGGTIIAVSSYLRDNPTNSGAVYIFDHKGNELGIITASDGAASDQFGYSIDVGTNKIVVGAGWDDDGGERTGSAYLYDHKGENEIKLNASDPGTYDYFGYDVGIGGTIVVVGAMYADEPTNSGAAYIFDLDGNQLGIITASDAGADDYFGRTLAVGPTKIVIGANKDDDNGTDAGAVYVYDHKGNNEVKITASDGAANDEFGNLAIAVNDKYIAVSAASDDDDGSGSGAAYIYDLDGNNEVKITTSDAYAGQYFPRTLSLSDDKLVGGVWSDDEVTDNAGAVYIFDLDYSIIDNQTGNLVIRNSSSSKKNILLQATSGENSIVCNDNSSVELYHDGTKKLETISTGATVTGDLYATTLYGSGANLTGILVDLVDDTTPQLGGNLDLNSKTINGTGNINITGIATATTFSLVDDKEIQLGDSQDLKVLHSTLNRIVISASDGAASDLYGNDVAIGTSKIVIGAYLDDDGGSASGSAYIYDHDGSNQVKITASDAAADDEFGKSVGIGGTIIVVGSKGVGLAATNAGKVYIFDLSGNQLGIVTASDGAVGDSLGLSVAVGTSKFVAGAPYDDDDGSASGSAYIFDHDGSNQVKITASDASSGDYFGYSVGIGATIIAVGARAASTGGALYLFDHSGNQLQKINPSDSASGDNFGWDVSVGPTKIIVGAWSDDSSQGSAYIYDIDGTNEIKLTASDGAASDYYGYSVAAGPTYVFVGAYQDDDDGVINSGSVYRYELDGSNETKLNSNDPQSNGKFGHSVAVGSGKVLIGERDGDGTNADGSGAAHLFNENVGSHLDNITGDLFIQNASNNINSNIFIRARPDKNSIICNDNDSVELYYNAARKLETIGTGVTVTGDLYATTFYGDGSNLTGVSGGISNVVEDTTPQLGGNLDLNSKFITGSGGVSVSGVVTSTSFVGDITGDVTGNADTATTATNVTVSANNSTDETVYPVFVDGATGTQGAETDTGLTYNPSSGTLTATTFSGSGSSLTGLTGASAATYGNSSATPVIVVDSNGRITGISTAAISSGGGGGGTSTGKVIGLSFIFG